ncbi:MAG: hypothetical protein GY821_04380, partial [Gammaproteobacteria bacterium]|nr:hypothetical protein [Gammaproteobacteria bacterium]
MTDCIYPEVKALQNISDISKVQALVEIFWKTIKFTDNSNLVSSSGSYHTLPNENTGNERFHQFIEWLIKKDFLGNDQLEIGLYRERIKIQLKEARQSASYDKTISLGRAINEYKKDREWFVEQAFNGQLGIFVVIDVGSLTYQPSKNRFCYTDIYGFKHYGKLIGERYFQSAFSEFSIKDLLQQSVNDAVVYDGIVLSDDKFIRFQPTEAENRLGFMPIFHKDWSQLTKIQDGRKVWDDEQFFFLKDEINGCLGGIRTTEEVDEPEEPPKTDSQYQRERAEKTPKRTQRKEYIELLIWFADQS